MDKELFNEIKKRIKNRINDNKYPDEDTETGFRLGIDTALAELEEIYHERMSFGKSNVKPQKIETMKNVLEDPIRYNPSEFEVNTLVNLSRLIKTINQMNGYDE
jgi:hypothetical protein